MEEEVLYARCNRELSLDEVVKRWSVSEEILKRYILAAPNAQALAWEFAAPGPNWRLVELVDLYDMQVAPLTSEQFASMFCGPSSAWDWECHPVREFAVYAEHNHKGVSDTRLGELAASSNAVLSDVWSETKRKRDKTPVSEKLHRMRAEIQAIGQEPPSTVREINLDNIMGEVRALLPKDELYAIEADLYPSTQENKCWDGPFDPSAFQTAIDEYKSRVMHNPAALSAILLEAIRRQRHRPRRPALWKAEVLLRTHFCELMGVSEVPDSLGAMRKEYRIFANKLCALNDIPPFSEDVLGRRKKPAKRT